MSWKSIVITGLLCVVASPVLAAPTASAKVLGLDTAGNWVWQVNVTPDAALFANNPPNGTGGSIALEIAATASGRNLVSAAANATNFPNNNPATAVPGFAFWGAADSGVKTNVATNQLVAGLGSTYFTAGTAQEAFRVHTQRPTSTATTTTLTLSGAYTGNGRLAQAGQNFNTVTGAINQSVRPGNANLSGAVDVGDLGILATNFNTTGKRWQDGDFTGDGTVNVGDLGVLATNFNLADPNWTVAGAVNLPVTPGAGSIGGSVVPEPTSIVMLLLACMSGLAIRRR
jgi:hypothetical protein